MTYDDGLESLDMPDADLKLTTVNALEAAALRLGIVARNGGLDKRYTKEDIDPQWRLKLREAEFNHQGHRPNKRLS